MCGAPLKMWSAAGDNCHVLSEPRLLRECGALPRHTALCSGVRGTAGASPAQGRQCVAGERQILFKNAMRHWENYTCVSFVERRPEHNNYVVFTQAPCGCVLCP